MRCSRCSAAGRRRITRSFVRSRPLRRRRGRAGTSTRAAASIHDVVRATEPGLAARLRYDDHERRSGLVRFLPLGATPDEWANVTVTDLGDALDRRARARRVGAGRVVVRREASIADGGAVRVDEDDHPRGRPARPDARRPARPREHRCRRRRGARRTRMDHDDARWRRQSIGLVGHRWRRGPGTTRPGRRPASNGFAQGNDFIGVAHRERGRRPPAEAWWAPLETISNSEQRLRARLPGQRLARLVAAAPGAGCPLVGHRSRTRSRPRRIGAEGPGQSVSPWPARHGLTRVTSGAEGGGAAREGGSRDVRAEVCERWLT